MSKTKKVILNSRQLELTIKRLSFEKFREYDRTSIGYSDLWS